jgi:hypothetical protein
MKWWYKFTSRWPRRLPQDSKDWQKLKSILVTYFNVKDNPKSWATIAGHVASIQTHLSTVKYATLANISNRLDVNAAAHAVQMEAVEELKKELAEKMKALAEETKATEVAAVIEEQASSANLSGGGHSVDGHPV